MSDATARMWLDEGVKTWSVPLDDARWRALVKLRPRMTLEFLLASGPGCLGPMLDFFDSLGRRRPMFRVDRRGGDLQVYATLGISARPGAHERAVAGSRRFTAKYRFELYTPGGMSNMIGRVTMPGDFDDIPELRREAFHLLVTEEGRALHIRESRSPRTIQRLAEAVGFPVPAGLARRLQSKPVEIPWTSLRAPWPLFTRWLDARRPRVASADFLVRSLPREAIAPLIDAGAEVEQGRRGAKVTAGGRARLDRVMETTGPCTAFIRVERLPGDARRGSLHVGRLKGTERDVSYDGYMLYGEWAGGRLSMWVGEEEPEWGEITSGLEAGG